MADTHEKPMDLDEIQVSSSDEMKAKRKRGKKPKKQSSSLSGGVSSALPTLPRIKKSRRKPEDSDVLDDNGDNDDLFSIYAVIMIFTSLTLALYLILPILWCLRIDHTVTWSWAIVCIPVWIFDAFLLFGLCCGNPTITAEDGTRVGLSTSSQLYALVKAALVLTAQVFLVEKLDGKLGWSVMQILALYFAYDALNIIDMVVEIFGKPHLFWKLFLTDDNNLVYLIVRFVEILLIALRLDGHLGRTSWWVIFTPAWVLAALALVVIVACVLRLLPNSVQFNIVTSMVHDVEAVPRLFAIPIVLIVALMVAPYVILAMRLESGSFSNFYVLLPFFILVGGLFIAGVLTMVIGLCMADYAKDDSPRDSKHADEAEYSPVQDQV
ncbi:hypothetical protein Poli38472_009363 [Pythium oligandrum]|uniref:Transmembrane protein n=1 Tax=Pythium oligandrum TaxID=41045 RepID=A0A8K1CKB5_PYTOL|nr:hypothetical protein Poli38472_009363 [Pythium oligandrum]|eukprot:TMW65196.1 hypothetical protein Poli38472_009363 [Pythium oligandrum]